MAKDPNELVHAFQAGDTGAVLPPGAADYVKAMGRLFSTEASRTHPLCVVQPRNATQVATILKIAREGGCAVTTRGGGHNSYCAADKAVMIDLSAHCATVVCTGNEVKVGGGATMGAILDALAPHGRLLPVGVPPLPGMGLALQGGVGYLSRSLGLTLDHLRAVEIVVPSGQVFELSEKSTGDEADLWWAVRGCAPNLGVVTSATFRV